jgi:hypothetical protein
LRRNNGGTQNGERQNHILVFSAFEGISNEIPEGPYEIDKFVVVGRGAFSRVSSTCEGAVWEELTAGTPAFRKIDPQQLGASFLINSVDVDSHRRPLLTA